MKKGNPIVRFLKKIALKLFTYFTTKSNWKKPGFWIIVLLGARFLLVFAREYGFTLFKKNLKGEHVFLTGAGSGIGRLMAIALGKQGCRLSLSDINM